MNLHYPGSDRVAGTGPGIRIRAIHDHKDILKLQSACWANSKKKQFLTFVFQSYLLRKSMSMKLPRGTLNYTLVFQIHPEKVFGFGWYVFWNPNTSSLSVFGNLRLGETELANEIENLLTFCSNLRLSVVRLSSHI